MKHYRRIISSLPDVSYILRQLLVMLPFMGLINSIAKQTVTFGNQYNVTGVLLQTATFKTTLYVLIVSCCSFKSIYILNKLLFLVPLSTSLIFHKVVCK
mgnify:CR=1 FL=1